MKTYIDHCTLPAEKIFKIAGIDPGQQDIYIVDIKPFDILQYSDKNLKKVLYIKNFKARSATEASNNNTITLYGDGVKVATFNLNKTTREQIIKVCRLTSSYLIICI